MKKISKILFSMCSFFMTGMGIERLYAATCTVNTLMASGNATVTLPGGDYNCTPTAVYGVQADDGGWWTVYGCANCGTGDTYTKINYGVMISSAFSCTIPVPYCVKNSGGTTGGGSTGGGSTDDDSTDVTEDWVITSHACQFTSQCNQIFWGATSAEYQDGCSIMQSNALCSGGYCYQGGDGNKISAVGCASGCYKDPSLSCDVSDTSYTIPCCTDCPSSSYEDEYGNVIDGWSPGRYMTGTGIDKCYLWTNKEAQDETGTWVFNQNCYYTE